MTEDEEILKGLDLMGDWLDAKGYTEEAGLCTRTMDKIILLKAIASKAIREQIPLGDEIKILRAENEKLRQAMHDIYEVYAGSEGFIPQTCPEAYLQERVKEMADIAAKHKRAAALKETGDE